MAGAPRLEPGRGAGADASPRRALVAGSIGNLVEWYDFALYGAFATVIGRTFFPGAGPDGGLVAAFGVFGVAFVARPVGALLFGHYGDRLGRRRTLAVGILLMAAVTAGIGALPGPTAIGPAAPVLLAILRFLQGVAVGGEYSGSAAFVVEHAPAGARGRFGGWQWATIGLGLAAGIGTAAAASAVLTVSQLASWGWRVPFLLALPLGLVGLYVRNRVGETPEFRTVERRGDVARVPLLETWRTARLSLAVGTGVVVAVVVPFNVFYVFLPNHLAANGDVPLPRALSAALVGLTIGSIWAPVTGRWSDRLGRKRVLVGGMLALLLAMAPAWVLAQRAGPTSLLLGYALVGVPLGSLAVSTFLAELFPTRLRYTGLSLSYGVASAVFGGSAPLVAGYLTARSGGRAGALWYATAAAAVGLAGAIAAPETAPRRSGDINPFG